MQEMGFGPPAKNTWQWKFPCHSNSNKSVISKQDSFNIRSGCSVANNFKSWELCRAKSELSHLIQGRFPARQADKRYSQKGTLEDSLAVQPGNGTSFHSSVIIFHWSSIFPLKHLWNTIGFSTTVPWAVCGWCPQDQRLRSFKQARVRWKCGWRTRLNPLKSAKNVGCQSWQWRKPRKAAIIRGKRSGTRSTWSFPVFRIGYQKELDFSQTSCIQIDPICRTLEKSVQGESLGRGTYGEVCGSSMRRWFLADVWLTRRTVADAT